jgi:predicted NBD/HSP70 family sugar kinase
MQFSQPASARVINKLRVLNLIARSQETSRADVARELGLNKVSTSEIVDQLVAEGMVSELGKRQTTVGRRPTDLALQKDAKAVISVDIGMRNTSITLVNLTGDPLRFERFPTPKHPSPEEMCATVIRTAKKILSRLKDPSIVSGMAVSINGVVEPATGTVLSLADWGWDNVPLAVALSRHLPFPVIVDNNVKCMVQGEKWFGSLSVDQSLFYVNWGEHIGAAWVLDGKVASNDCQFGHLPIAKSGLCHCGAIGCLETVASGWALVEEALMFSKESELTVKQLCARSETDPNADAILRRACEAMANAIISAAAILRPDRILIGGGISGLPERYFHLLKDTYAQRAPARISMVTKLDKATLGERAGAMGTAAVALDEFIFKRSLLDQLRRHQGS